MGGFYEGGLGAHAYFDPEIDFHLVYEEGLRGHCTNCCQSNIRYRFVARETKSSPLPEVATG